MILHKTCWVVGVLSLLTPALHAQPADIVFADFEGQDHGGWKATGEAFGPGPARGTLPNQMAVTGFLGRGLVNSFYQGDRSTGTLTSPEFKIGRRYITFLIGGGGFADRTCMNLLVAGRIVRTATGPNTQPGGSERLEPASWDVGEFLGKTATLQIVDSATSGWGHINVDHIVFTDRKPPALLKGVRRELTAQKQYLHLPVKNGSPKRAVSLRVDGRVERWFEIELADGEPDWWAFVDIAPFKSRKLVVEVDQLREHSTALARIEQGDALKGAEDLYREPLRPQMHFSARRGWLNDPNGLVFYKGEYHLFFQHNPYGWNWGNMHWGHAVSRDLVHWEELGEALYPDDMGTMFSGSAVVDWNNTSGWGRAGQPPLVLFYTAAGGTNALSRGKPFTQCAAYSFDQGRTWTKYAGNPVLGEVAPENRDPKVLWHGPSKRWVMVLYVGVPRKDPKGGPAVTHTIQFFTSPNLKDWTFRSQTDGFFECPDLFELPVDGDPRNTKWVLTAASSEYLVGTFDGEKFTPETPKLPGHRGRGFYAAQTFSDIPAADGRRIQIGWGQMPSPGMPFNQMMCFPCELTLRSTPEGPRLAWQPVKEHETLRVKSHRVGPQPLRPGDNPLAHVRGELLEIRAEIEPGDAAEFGFVVRGTPIRYEVRKQELVTGTHPSPAPLRGGRQRIIVLVDRTCLVAFAADGMTYVPFPVLSKPDNRSVELFAKGGTARVRSLEVHELGSIWSRPLP